MYVPDNELIKAVLRNSEATTFEDAAREWEVYDFYEDMSASTVCICGQTGLRYGFTIHNVINNKILRPIGSSCINKFGVEELNEQVSIIEQEFKLYHAVENKEYLKLKSDIFSRKLLNKLYKDGAFKATPYNDYSGKNDYKFMLDMFNKRKELSEKQEKKTKAIILNSIRPFIQDKLAKKIKNS